MNQVPVFSHERKKNMTEIKIGGRRIPLFYSAYEMIAIQKDLGCTAFQLKEEVFGLEQDENDDENKTLRMSVATDPEKTEKFAKLLRILGNAGLEESGQEPDLTDKWVMRNMKPAMIMAYAVLVMTAIIEGNSMEGPQQDEEGPVDEILEAENAKKQPGN